VAEVGGRTVLALGVVAGLGGWVVLCGGVMLLLLELGFVPMFGVTLVWGACTVEGVTPILGTTLVVCGDVTLLEFVPLIEGGTTDVGALRGVLLGIVVDGLLAGWLAGGTGLVGAV
jgi:hypothetical protein